MRARIALGGLWLAAVVVPNVALADGMRCGTKLVGDGDAMFEVRNVCGAPDQALQRMERRQVSRWIEVPCGPNGQARCNTIVQDSVEVQVDEWLYDFGPNQFVQTLTFESGKLVRIVSGGYGTKQT